ncbi:hypothetical protein [Methylomonas methanica]|uniref:Uncharacterized protein n=1 Tax=Methylomonas methanica TaxID=421 RepID=A0A177MGZ8_METMH|nr:hypothetical protein [Methylomonas methanica]OAI04892.1 hypothetical protein A1332_13785 [Methylomonas methanica]
MQTVNIPVTFDDVAALEFAIELIMDDIRNTDHRDFPNDEEFDWAINRKKAELERIKELVFLATR